MIPDEPARGRTPPPWLYALSGIERHRAFSRGRLPSPPLARLLGMRTTHVAAGTLTNVMPASDACIAGNGQLEIIPLAVKALEGAIDTALTEGFYARPGRFTFEPFRPAWPGRGNLLARARVVNSGSIYVFSEVEVEDPDGRRLGQGNLISEILRVEPAPPQPPETMLSVDEPTYQTPDPYLRNFSASAFGDLMEREDGLAIIRGIADGRLTMPLMTLYDQRVHEVSEGKAVISLPASEWFCTLRDDVCCSVIAAFADMSAWTMSMSTQRAGELVASIGHSMLFLRQVPADGRRLRAESVADEPTPGIIVEDTRIFDADGLLVARRSGAWKRVAPERRTRRERQTSQRVLATLLFTDIVDSTGHAERLGDAGWRELLEQHKLAIRREVSRHNGIEVDTAGDGFFVRFDSPAKAVEAARAAQHATMPLGIEIRAGIHTGECELQGNRLAGMAVHIAARLQAAAQPGEILVSSTVKDLAVGSTLRFTDKGEQQLKGVPDPWRVFAVVD